MQQTASAYEIRVEGHLNEYWSEWFGGMALFHTANGVTILKGTLPDQAALYGALMKMRDLGLTLISASRIEPDT